MIYYNYIDPAQAKPGDYMIETKGEYVHLYLCIRSLSDNDMNGWWIIKRFSLQDYSSEIIDGKPTLALIARFTSPDVSSGCVEERKSKSLEIYGTVFIEKAWGITEIPPIDSVYFDGSERGHYEFIVKATGISDMYFNSKEQAETERARLIGWLEEA